MTYDKHDCDLMCERLAAYIEGDLSPSEREQADHHLAECAACAEALVEPVSYTHLTLPTKA